MISRAAPSSVVRQLFEDVYALPSRTNGYVQLCVYPDEAKSDRLNSVRNFCLFSEFISFSVRIRYPILASSSTNLYSVDSKSFGTQRFLYLIEVRPFAYQTR